MGTVLPTALRVLTLRLRPEDVRGFGPAHLSFGLVATWLVGMGRYWDNPRVGWAQHLGLGSLVYVPLLSLFLWLVLIPLRPAERSPVRLLTFVALTAPPAALYAIPVERWLDLESARSVNVALLGIVALWRVAMYATYVRRAGRLPALETATAVLLPLGLIVTVLTFLNLERAVFDVMAGLGTDGTAADEAYAALVLVTVFSWLATPILALLYVVALNRVHRPLSRRAAERREAERGEERREE